MTTRPTARRAVGATRSAWLRRGAAPGRGRARGDRRGPSPPPPRRRGRTRPLPDAARLDGRRGGPGAAADRAAAGHAAGGRATLYRLRRRRREARRAARAAAAADRRGRACRCCTTRSAPTTPGWSPPRSARTPGTCDAGDWRQAVLKCVFIGVPLAAVDGLAERADAELARCSPRSPTSAHAAGRDDARRRRPPCCAGSPSRRGGVMRIFDPHIHMTSRTTDDYERMAAAGRPRAGRAGVLARASRAPASARSSTTSTR